MTHFVRVVRTNRRKPEFTMTIGHKERGFRSTNCRKAKALSQSPVVQNNREGRRLASPLLAHRVLPYTAYEQDLRPGTRHHLVQPRYSCQQPGTSTARRAVRKHEDEVPPTPIDAAVDGPTAKSR